MLSTSPCILDIVSFLWYNTNRIKVLLKKGDCKKMGLLFAVPLFLFLGILMLVAGMWLGGGIMTGVGLLGAVVLQREMNSP